MKKVALLFALMAMAISVHAELFVARGGETIGSIIRDQCGSDADISKVVVSPRNIPQDKPLDSYMEVRYHCYGYNARRVETATDPMPLPELRSDERVVMKAPEPPKNLRVIPQESVVTPTVTPTWQMKTKDGIHYWNPGSKPFKGVLSDAIEEMYGDVTLSAEIAKQAREGKYSEAFMDCSGNIQLEDATLKALQMAFGKNHIISADAIIPIACKKNPQHKETFHVFRNGTVFFGIPPACGNPTKLVPQEQPVQPETQVPNVTPTVPVVSAEVRQEECLKRMDGYVGGGFDFDGASGRHGWVGFDGYCRVFVDGQGGKHFLGFGADLFGGKGKAGDWSYQYQGFKFRPVAYYWEDVDGKKTLRLRPVILIQPDKGNDDGGYANTRHFAMAGVEIIYEEDYHQPGSAWTGWRLSGSYMWVISRDGSHSWLGVPIENVSSVVDSIRNVLQIGGRVYVYDLEGDNGRIFAQTGYRHEVGGSPGTIGVAIGYESKDAIVEVWVGPTWNMEDWSRTAFIGAQYNFGKKMLVSWSDQRIACAEEKLGTRENGCASSAYQSPIRPDMTVPLK